MSKQSTRSKPSAGTPSARKQSRARQAISSAAVNRSSGDQRPQDALVEQGVHEERGAYDERESLVNDRRRGTKYEITPKVEEVAAIHGFMNDFDCKMLDPAVVGVECVESAEAFYSQHVRLWLDRDPVLAKAEVRDTGGGLHTILWLDEPILVAAGEARIWNDIARGICNALPGDPELNGLIALTRPVAAMNTKYNPPREVRQLRLGEPVSRAEILNLSRLVAEQPARLWMQLFFGGERAEPCPFCSKESLGVAGYWQVRCYQCGRANAASLVYRFYSPDFLDSRKENHHG